MYCCVSSNVWDFRPCNLKGSEDSRKAYLSFRLVVPLTIKFSNKLNLRSKFKLADKELDKVRNNWILLIYKEYISTCTE